jgi:5'-methylthioadenosine phosphorylase
MKHDYRPGDIVVPNQFIDFTKGRQYSFYDGGQICHISVADPFCPELCDIVWSTAKSLNYNAHPNTTYICIEGPRFSTRAESQFFRDIVKADIIGMTLVPECSLAREAEVCYVSVATVTDYDVWTTSSVSTKEVIDLLDRNIEKVKNLIANLIPAIPPMRTVCKCANALEGALL